MMPTHYKELEANLLKIKSSIELQDASDAKEIIQKFKKLLSKNERNNEILYLLHEILFDLSIVYDIDRRWLIEEGRNLLQGCQEIGNARAECHILMRIGVLYLWLNQEKLALNYFETGLGIAEKLDDIDLLSEIAPYNIIYQTILGNITTIKEQMRHLGPLSNLPTSYFSRFFFLTFLSLALTIAGNFELGVQVMTLCCQFTVLAKAAHVRSSAFYFMSTVYTSMHLFNKAQEYIDKAELINDKDMLPETRFWKFRSLAFFHFTKGEQKITHKYMLKANEIIKAGAFIPYTSRPNFLEMFYTLRNNKGYDTIDLDYKSAKTRFITSSNRYLCAYGHIIQAREFREDTRNNQLAIEELDKAKRLLVDTGAKTTIIEMHLEYARIARENDQQGEIKSHIQQAWNIGLSNLQWLLPKDLASYRIHQQELTQGEILWNYFKKFISLNSSLNNCTSYNDVLTKSLNLLCTFFRAESAAVFREDLQRIFRCVKATNAAFQQTSVIDIIEKDKINSNTPFIAETILDGRLYDDSIVLILPLPQSQRLLYILEVQPRMLPNLEVKEIIILAQHILESLKTSLNLFEGAKKTRVGSINVASMPTESNGVVWKSPAMNQVLKLANIASTTNASVLLLGETGSGKTMLAKYIHDKSKRENESFISMDIGSLSENLLESELFGHEKGAFTGAMQRKLGFVEMADNGTLFLDEIGEIPIYLQAKLLRLLQDKVFCRVGGTKEISSDFRLISATNIEFDKAISEQKFREDLYYRINVIPITVPPLRKRPEDIRHLASSFFDHFSKKHHLPIVQLSEEQEEALVTYSWPGNVRELRNYSERATILQTGDIGTILSNEPFFEQEDNIGKKSNHKSFNTQKQFNHLPTMDEMQTQYINYLQELTNNKISGENSISAILNMKRTTLYNRMIKLNINYKN